MLSVKLVVVGGEAKSKELTLQLPTIIGRGREGVTLTLPHPLVSRKHTELFEEEGKLFVKDLGSLNGTFVNNRRITSRTPLEPNELLTLGNVTFRAVYNLGGAKHAAGGASSDSQVDVLHDDEAESGGSDTNKSISVADVEEAAAPIKVTVGTRQAAAQPNAVPEAAEPLSAADCEKMATPKRPMIAGLPTEEKIDFAFQIEGTATPEAIQGVEIDLDKASPASPLGDSRFGSFLKKMPR